MATIYANEAGAHACPYRNFEPCLGSACMAWIWAGQPDDRCETDNLVSTGEGAVIPVGVPSTPQGEGWLADGAPFAKSYHRSRKEGLPPATGQRWRRKRERSEGSCGRVGGHNEGFW